MNLCIRCKGRGFCKRPKCTILEKMKVQKKANKKFKKEFMGNSPNVFVGRNNYPNINVGILATEYKGDDSDNPMKWSSENYSVDKVIELRSNLINSNFKSNILLPRQQIYNNKQQEKLTKLSKEISLSKKTVDTEVSLDKVPKFNLSYNQDAAPHGPAVRVEKAKATENIRVPTKVDKVVGDNSLKASDAINYLHKKNFDEHYLTKIFSLGNIGIKPQRKLVPTRWSITAIDDTLGKEKINKIKDYTNQTGFLAYFGGHLGNYYLALFFPDVWSYELFETYLPGALWNQQNGANIETATDYEPFTGRREYAFNTAGGYYAARLPVLEHLESLRRQGSVLLLRFITDEYHAPLGVWVVREASRKTLNTKPIEFASKELMVIYAKKLIKKRFNFDIEPLLQKSLLLDNINKQKKLFEF